MNLRRVSSEFFDARKDFMAENDGIWHLQLAVKVFHVRAADAAHLDFQQATVRRNVGHRIFADLEFIGAE